MPLGGIAGWTRITVKDCLDNTVPMCAGSGMQKYHSSGELLDAVAGIRRDYKRRPVMAKPKEDASMRMTLSDMRLQTLKERMPQPENLGDLHGRMSWPTISSDNRERRYAQRCSELEAAEKKYKAMLAKPWPLPDVYDSRPGAPEDRPRVWDSAPQGVMLSTLRHDFFPRSQEVLKDWQTGKNPDNCRQKDWIYEYREKTMQLNKMLGKPATKGGKAAPTAG